MLHVNRVNDPNSFEYLKAAVHGDDHDVLPVIIQEQRPKINLYFNEVLEDLVKSGEITLESSFASLKKHDYEGDFKFILIDRVMLKDNPLSGIENFTLTIHNVARMLSTPDVKALQLDSTMTIVEQVPITIDQPVQMRINRVE